MTRIYFLALIILTLLSVAYCKTVNSITSTEHVYISMLKNNIDKEYIFEGSLSYVGNPFYVNSNNMLQADGIKQSICKNLALDDYSCDSGTLITKLSIDPSIKATETMKKANIKIIEVNAIRSIFL